MAENVIRQRLAAILAADVAGYSRLMGDDERATIDAINRCRAVFRDHIEANGGRVVDMAGDSVLAIFDTAIGVFTTAMAAQERLADLNTDVAENRRMAWRIGVNLGDIHEQDDGTVYGDGVNVAARLEALAEPGGICVSGKVRDELRGKVERGFADLGEHNVKNIAEPVRAYRIVDSGDDESALEGEAEDAASESGSIFDQPAIAILPFDNMSGDADQEFFVDGLTEDIITALAAWRSFPVIARNSTFAYKGQSPDIRQVGKELGARYVLEGGVRKGSNRLRVTAQLIDASTGHHLWADRFDRELEDIFELQDEITHRIAAIVAPEIERAEQNRLAVREHTNLAAWQFYQRGMALLEDFTKAGNAEARELFSRAISLDSKYGLAYGGLAASHNRDLMLEFGDDREESAALALEASTRAVEIDQTDSYAHALLAVAHMWPNRFAAAVREAERAIELNPSNAHGLSILGIALEAVGRHDEAIVSFEQAIRLNPRDPRMSIYHVGLARAHLGARRYEEAAEVARQTINERPDFPHSHYILACALGHLGRYEEARRARRVRTTSARLH